MSDKTAIIVAGANGRMGKTIISLVQSDQAFILAGVIENKDRLAGLEKLNCPVATSLAELPDINSGCIVIDFSAPAATIKTAEIAARNHIPMVIGTTGFDNGQKSILENLAKQSPVLCSANMSVGVNALLYILPLLAQALGENYDMEIMEIHHKHKKDSPSGTALMLADALAKARDWDLDDVRRSKRDGIIGERPGHEIGVQALRGGDVVGIHTCYFLGPGEIIEVSHQAESRENFARGALRAAQWLSGQKAGRLYNMQDVILKK